MAMIEVTPKIVTISRVIGTQPVSVHPGCYRVVDIDIAESFHPRWMLTSTKTGLFVESIRALAFEQLKQPFELAQRWRFPVSMPIMHKGHVISVKVANHTRRKAWFWVAFRGVTIARGHFG